MLKGRLIMPKRLACAVALIMFAGYSAALAADFGRPPPPPAYPGALPPPVYPIFSWTGIYVGVNGGGAFGQATGPIHSSERPETLMSVADSSAARLAAIISLLVRRSWLASKATPTGRTSVAPPLARQAGVKWWAANLGAIFSPQYGDVLVGRGAARCSTEQRAPRSVTSRLLQARFLSVARQRRVGPLA